MTIEIKICVLNIDNILWTYGLKETAYENYYHTFRQGLVGYKFGSFFTKIMRTRSDICLHFKVGAWCILNKSKSQYPILSLILTIQINYLETPWKWVLFRPGKPHHPMLLRVMTMNLVWTPYLHKWSGSMWMVSTGPKRTSWWAILSRFSASNTSKIWCLRLKM